MHYYVNEQLLKHSMLPLFFYTSTLYFYSNTNNGVIDWG